MATEQRIAAYLAQAKHAEEQAAKAVGASAKEGWLHIALGYQHLAQSTLSGVTAAPVAEQFSPLRAAAAKQP